MYFAQNIPLPTLDQLGNASPVTIMAFIVLSALFVVGLVVSLVGGGGFFFLRGMLQVLQAQQKVIAAQQEIDKELGNRIDAVNSGVDKYSGVVMTGLDQLRSSLATKTGQVRQEDLVKGVTDNVSGGTQRLETAMALIPKATTDLIIPVLDSFSSKLNDILEISTELKNSVSPDTIRTLAERLQEVAELKTTLIQMVTANSKASAQSDRDQDASDKTIDKQAKQIVTDSALIAALTKDDVLHPDPLVLDAGAKNRDELEATG